MADAALTCPRASKDMARSLDWVYHICVYFSIAYGCTGDHGCNIVPTRSSKWQYLLGQITPQLVHQIAVSLILWTCPFPISARALMKSTSKVRHTLVGAPLHRAGAMFSHLLDGASHTTHLKLLPNFLPTCPPKCARRSSMCSVFALAFLSFLLLGLAAAVSSFG